MGGVRPGRCRRAGGRFRAGVPFAVGDGRAVAGVDRRPVVAGVAGEDRVSLVELEKQWNTIAFH